MTEDDRTPEEKLADLERISREQDARSLRQDELGSLLDAARAVIAGDLDAQLVSAADSIAGSIVGLAAELARLDLIDEDDPGAVRMRVDLGAGVFVNAIEVDHPDGTRLYTLDGVDTIMASRLRDDGRLEHAVLDENGQPLEWRSVYRPELN